MIKMRALYTVIFLLFSSSLLAQSEIIERKTKRGKEFNLKITDVTADSIIYKHHSETASIALVDVIAYRHDDSEEYTFPNPADKEKYEIKNMYAVDKSFGYYDLKRVDQKEMFIQLLKSYEVPKEEWKHSTLNNKMILTKTNTSQFEKASAKRSFFILLKKDVRALELKVKSFKIIDDSVLYVCIKIKKRDERFYAIPVKDIKCLKLESQKKFAIRMVAGVVSCGLVIFPPLVLIPIHVFSHPFIDTYDLERTWKLKLKG